MSDAPEAETIMTRQAVEALRAGNSELLAQKIEAGRGAIFLCNLHPDDRARFARLVRTGDPLTRGEKRQNNEACIHRDIFLITRIFYWLGNGCPGFSNTAADTAFHKATEDYESDIIPNGPPRTPESLYRHTWKPYLRRHKSGNKTVYDETSIQHQALSQFLLGLRRSNPSQVEAYERLTWFYREFVRDGERFTLHKFQIQWLRIVLDIANMCPELWRPHLRIFFEKECVIDEILRG